MRTRKVILWTLGVLAALLWWMHHTSRMTYEEAEMLRESEELAHARKTLREWTEACYGAYAEGRRYRTTDTIIECFREASYLFGGRAAFSVSEGAAVLTVDDPECTGEAAEDKWHVLVVCGQHARELVTSELCLDLLYEVLFASEPGMAWHFLPVMNPAGRERVERDVAREGCWRGNAGGVDLNRNFPSWVDDEHKARVRAQWERHANETSPGAYPGSERETRAVMEVLTRDDLRVDMVLNVHSGTEAVAVPYDCCALERHPLYSQMVHAAQTAKRPLYEDPGELGREVHEKLQQWLEKLPVQQASHATILYESVGTLVDYAVGVARVPVGYTVEIFGVDEPAARVLAGPDATEGEVCFAQFNPAPGEALDRALRVWSRYLCDLAHAWKALAGK